MQSPTHAALVVADTGTTLSHQELREASARVATALFAQGLRPGDTVAVLAEPGAEHLQVRVAARRIGVFVVALDPALSLEERAFVINDSGARTLFVSERYAADAGSLRPLTPGVELRCSLGGSLPDHVPFGRLLEPAADGQVELATDLSLYYTAGTRARPRGVRRIGVAAGLLQVDRRTVLFSPTPWSDPVGAQLFEAVLEAGGTLVTLTEFDAASAQTAMAEHAPTLLHLLPWHLLRLMKHGTVPALEATLVHSSAPCPGGVKRWALDWLDDRVLELYGGAACDVLTKVDGPEWRERPGTVGRAVQGAIHVCDATGDELPPGAVGLVYFDQGHEVPSVPDVVMPHPRNRSWFSLGDLGRVDKDGYLSLVDPARELEDLLVVHPKVADAAVIPLDVHLDAGLRAVVQPAEGITGGVALDRELRAYLRGRVSSGLVPRAVDFAATLPRTGTGKLVRRKLVARFALSDTVIV
ncbi:MAG TPA: AMP-binding protein [Nocardioidaceae bacterium]|nr:AMP-binding protein [Nocardioidaceae bacterium]